MKTIVETATGLSKYLLADDVAITVGVDRVVVGDPPQFIISDMNATNAAIHENVLAPADWIGNKYTYDGDGWTLNPDYVDPEAR